MKIVISNASQDPIYEQIARQIREQIIRGELSAGDALPSIRNLAKYCSGFVYAAVGLLATALMSWIISGLGLPVSVRPISMMDMAGALAGTILFCGYYFPLYFKLGNIKIRYVNLSIFLLFFFVPNLLADYLRSHQGTGPLLLSTIRQVPPWLLWSGTAAVLLALLLLSLTISLRIYEHKDL